MANITFGDLKQNFSIWRDEIDNHATEKQPDGFFTNTASGHYVTIHGTNFEYQNGVPRNGHVDSMDIKLGGAKAVADVTITGIDAPFVDYAEVVSSPSPIDRTMALWSATLRGNDTIDFGTNASGAYSITFAGDGYEAPDKRVGGNDVVRGDLFEGSFAGDFVTVGLGRTVDGGDDDIQLTHSRQTSVMGDVFEGVYGSEIFGGNDTIKLDYYGFAYGDAGTTYGVLHAGDDTIAGGDENDALYGDVGHAGNTSRIYYGDDVIHGGDGDDYIYGDYQSSASTNFNAGKDKLWGDGGDDHIFAEEGNDKLDGGTGNDLLNAGFGDDTVRGGGGRDTVLGGGGSDTVDYSDKKVSVVATLGGSTPTQVLVGGVAEDQVVDVESLIGGSVNDKFVTDIQYEDNLFDGRTGNDTLSSGSGRDTLIGGAGKDKLIGGTGADQFRFDTKLGSTNVDKIADFTHGTDKIALDDDVFQALGSSFDKSDFGALASGHVATSTSQHVIYDKAHHSLWYDADGKGGHDAVKFAQLGSASSETLNWHDFAIV